MFQWMQSTLITATTKFKLHIQILKSPHQSPEVSLLPLAVNHCPTSALGNNWSVITIAFLLLEFHRNGISSQSFESGFLHLACYWDSSFLLHISVVAAFTLQSSTPLHGYTIFYISFHKSVDICVVSSLQTLSIMLWTFMDNLYAMTNCFKILSY